MLGHMTIPGVSLASSAITVMHQLFPLFEEITTTIEDALEGGLTQEEVQVIGVEVSRKIGDVRVRVRGRDVLRTAAQEELAGALALFAWRAIVVERQFMATGEKGAGKWAVMQFGQMVSCCLPAIAEVAAKLELSLQDGTLTGDEAATLGELVSRNLGNLRVNWRGYDLLLASAQDLAFRALARIVRQIILAKKD